MENEKQSTADQHSSSHALSLILTFCAISAIFIYLIYSQNVVFGSKIGGRVYSYFESLHALSIGVLASVIALTAVFIYLGSRLIVKHEKVALLACFVIAIAIQILIQQVYPYSLAQIIKSDGANSFYTPAIKYTPLQILSQYLSLAHSFPNHARTNMPGKILFFQLIAAFTSSPQVMGYLIIAFSTLGGLILYAICRHLFQDQRLALYAFMLYVLIPCKQEFFPILNTVTPVFILVCLYFFVLFLDSRHKWALISLGIFLYGLVLFEPSPLVTGILFVGILIYALVEKKVTLKDLLFIVGIPLLSFLFIYLLFDVAFNFDLWRSTLYVLQDAVVYNSRTGLNYMIWLKENSKEFFFGTGLPTMLIFFYVVIDLLCQWKQY